jgi:hypothetical protein
MILLDLCIELFRVCIAIWLLTELEGGYHH